MHDAPARPGRVEVEVDTGRTGRSEHLELDLPALDEEERAIRRALPETAEGPEAAEPTFDIPIVVNRQVERWIEYFQTAGRKHMALWLARSGRYIPLMQAILKEHGLPTDLVYLALIESGFSTSAYSPARALGPWQFIASTARRYGLRIDWWIDERRDPEKSTIAAANYLKDLYDMFGSWYLAAAGYNAGEGRIIRAVDLYDTDDFWKIAERRYLRAETREYVPKLIAAAIIAKSPEKYGFADIDYHDPLVYDKVTVPDATDLRVIARAAETTYEEIKRLNPELLRWATPPDYPGYEVKIPFGKKGIFERNFGRIAPDERITYRRHVVRRGDTLLGVAAAYGAPVEQLRRLNGLRGSLLRVGQSLVVPLPASRASVVAAQRGEPEPGLAGSQRTVP
ncbi:MAG TPA: transglycosylase SLT domain-containing protein, partial [Thermodesulfobacteriota bacterium]|nr:transglycosylase SLT domain-containing protein [Thermodesulfobacteriota bacterium]